MNAREKIAEATRNARSQGDMDRLAAIGVLKTLCNEYPAADVFYEWDSRKMDFRGRMTENDE